VLESQLEASRMMDALKRLQDCEFLITKPKQVTPLSFPLLVDKLRERVSSESLVDRVARMQAQLEKAVQEDSK
jgi:ATP-dependent Lhr-like helicase